jgi:TPR repeat protein
MVNKLMDERELMKLEPDVKRLSRAHTLLSIAPAEGIRDLEALAATGSVMAMLYLGQLYSLGQFGEDTNFEMAEKWYLSAYRHGSSSGLFNLGSLYYQSGKNTEAETIWSEGVAKDDAPSMYWLATLYLTDPYFGEKRGRAQELLEKAAAAGQVYAQMGLGIMYMRGRYGLGNIPRGLKLYLEGFVNAVCIKSHAPSDRRLL